MPEYRLMISSVICYTELRLILNRKNEGKMTENCSIICQKCHFLITSLHKKKCINEKHISKRKILNVLPVFQPCLGLHSQGLICDLCPPKRKSVLQLALCSPMASSNNNYLVWNICMLQIEFMPGIDTVHKLLYLFHSCTTIY